MQMLMLGTGNAVTTQCYNTCYVLSDDIKGKKPMLLVDGGGGNGILAQLQKANIDFRDIRQIMVTHKHLDHILGVVWLVRMICQYMTQNMYEGEAYIYGHEEVIDLVEDISKKLIRKKDIVHIGSRLHFIKVAHNESVELIGHRVTFFDIESKKDTQFGYVMEYEGKRLACCGDETYHECNEEYVRNADWLLHEAFCLDSQADVFKPYEKGHSTVKDACIIAKGLNVNSLLLYHTEDKNIEKRKELYMKEAKEFFEGRVEVPDDFELLEI